VVPVRPVYIDNLLRETVAEKRYGFREMKMGERGREELIRVRELLAMGYDKEAA
jgi:hypothetical protein